MTKKQLQQRNITRPLALAPSVPNMNSNHVRGLGASNAIFIRGIGNSDSMAGYDPAVGTTVDGIFIARQNFNDFTFFDIDRVEVLRGSQGTAGGRNIAAGSVDVYFQKPQPTLSGNTEIGYGKNSTKFVRGTINAPISDMLLTQVGAYYNDDNGYVRNTTTGDKLNDMRNYGARIVTPILDAMGIAYEYLHSAGDEQRIAPAIERAYANSTPLVLLVGRSPV